MALNKPFMERPLDGSTPVEIPQMKSFRELGSFLRGLANDVVDADCNFFVG